MFRSAVWKLTAWYVGALLLVCILFSLPMYSVASSRLRRGAENQTEVVRDLPYHLVPNGIVQILERQRERQLADDRHELLLTLLTINGIIIIAGGVASFIFARRTLQPIEVAHAAQTRFTADASHELRTPLAVMQTEIEVALRSRQLTAKQAKDILSSNLEEVARLRQLSDQLLGLTRADAEPIKLTKVEVSQLLRDQAKILTKRHGKQIKVDSPTKITAKVDKLLLAQVLGILVDNAVAYSGQDDPKLCFTAKTRRDHLVINVTNQGRLITKSELDHIFDRFYRGPEATKTNPKGHGLGLALAQEIITRHNGELTASSKKSKTNFAIYLPLGV